jgi:hypothetical protein
VLTELQSQLGLQGTTVDGRSLVEYLLADETLSTELAPAAAGATHVRTLVTATASAIMEALIIAVATAQSWAGAALTYTAAITAAICVVITFQSPFSNAMWSTLSTFVLRKRTATLRRAAAFAPEQFEFAFRTLVRAARTSGYKKLLIVFDNIDRLHDDSAMDVLSAIKTYMDIEGCVYLIPCDDTRLTIQIKDSLGIGSDTAAGTEHASEFLQKFFQLTLRLPAIATPDYTRFVDSQVTKAGLENILSVRGRDLALLAYGRETPRKIKRFINDFIGYWQIASTLEEEGFLEAGAITAYPDFLAKMTVIYQLWPESLDDLAETLELVSTGTLAQELMSGQPPALCAFLQASVAIETPPSLHAFRFLKRGEFFRDPQSAAVADQAIRSRDGNRFRELMAQDNLTAADAVAVALDRMLVIGRQPGLISENAAHVLLDSELLIPEAVREKVWSSLGRHFAAVVALDPAVAARVYAPARLARVVNLAPAQEKPKVTDAWLRLIFHSALPLSIRADLIVGFLEEGANADRFADLEDRLRESLAHDQQFVFGLTARYLDQISRSGASFTRLADLILERTALLVNSAGPNDADDTIQAALLAYIAVNIFASSDWQARCAAAIASRLSSCSPGVDSFPGAFFDAIREAWDRRIPDPLRRDIGSILNERLRSAASGSERALWLNWAVDLAPRLDNVSADDLYEFFMAAMRNPDSYKDFAASLRQETWRWFGSRIELAESANQKGYRGAELWLG